MVTKVQESKIRSMMKRIKEARDQDMGEEVIRNRTNKLYNYLENEGLINRFTDE